MKRSTFSEEQIIAISKEQEAGMATADVCRRHGISEGVEQLLIHEFVARRPIERADVQIVSWERPALVGNSRPTAAVRCIMMNGHSKEKLPPFGRVSARPGVIRGFAHFPEV